MVTSTIILVSENCSRVAPSQINGLNQIIMPKAPVKWNTILTWTCESESLRRGNVVLFQEKLQRIAHIQNFPFPPNQYVISDLEINITFK